MLRLLPSALIATALIAGVPASAQGGDEDIPDVAEFVEELTNPTAPNRNRPGREEWLQDNGFGIFVSLGLEAPLGMVMSHALVGADEAFTRRYFETLPDLFVPSRYDADELARLIRLSGARYGILTAKHHSGFALWDSASTDFDIAASPYGRDMVGPFVDALRRQNLATGLYYSPEDFHWAHSVGIRDFDRLTVKRDYRPHRDSFEKLVGTQIRELFSDYGPIDIFFNDGAVFGTVNPIVWDLQPETLITRTAIPTPEQTVPGIGYDRVWESIITMTDQWNYKASDVDRKSPAEVIATLIETRAKGGALLLNLALAPDGSIPVYEQDMLRTIGAWNFINSEAIFGVRPWVVTHEGGTWFTRSKDGPTLYAILQGQGDWPIGERRRVLLRSVEATPETRISVLGASGRIVEYRQDLAGKAEPRFEQGTDGLILDIMRTQRIHNDYNWPYPLVVKLENVTPRLDPPVARTLEPKVGADTLVLAGDLLKMGDRQTVDVAFEYRPYGGFAEDYAKGLGGAEWQRTKPIALSKLGTFATTIDRPAGAPAMIYRAIALHPTGIVIDGNAVIVDENGAISTP